MAELNVYRAGTAFSGVVGRTVDTSSPAWPQVEGARAGAPNVVFIVLDDLGFAQLGSYGSPISTPNLDELAAQGLRYTNFHTTALCSPSRSCILTGRNHHSNGMACITEGATGYPGSNGIMPMENGMLSEMLVDRGYSAYAVGKWHLTPGHELSPAGPYVRWPLGRGFERFYGFLGGDTHQYYPELVYDNHQVEPEKTPEEGYHLTEDIVDRAISFIADTRQVAPDKPFFLYFATGAMHAPHHVPAEWADKYKGQFDEGWDAYRTKAFARQKELGIIPAAAELSRHDPDVKPWEDCTPDERKVFARMMEVYAGFLEHTDYHIGRLIDFLKRIDAYDNTVIMAVSDNGGSSEGGPNGMININMWHNNLAGTLEDNLAVLDELGGPKHFNHYAWGWTFAGNAPFRRWKRETYRGGISDPLIVCWPAGIKAKGAVRTQYVHAIDLVPTVLDALGGEPPNAIRGVTQSEIEGLSFAHTFDDGDAASRRRTQYFEMMGHRSIYHDGWRAVCPWPGSSFAEAGKFFGVPITADDLVKLDASGWELYHVDEDHAENHNVAASNPGKLNELISLWYVEAGRFDVLPLDSRGATRIRDARPQASAPRSRYAFYPGTQAVPGGATVNVINRPHSITADAEIPAGGAEGVLLSFGGNEGGYTFFMQEGKLQYVQNVVGAGLLQVVSTEPVPGGRHSLRFEFEPTGEPDIKAGKGVPGRAQLYIDGRLAGQSEFAATVPITYGLGGGVVCGADTGSPVTDAYAPPFHFTGTIHEVVVEVDGELIVDHESEIKRILAHQ